MGMARTNSTTTKTAGAVLVAATLLGLASPASARSLPDSFASSRCRPLDTAALDLQVLRSGVRVSYAGDRYATCDEAVVITSHASAGPVVDNHDDPVLQQVVLQASALEAAGPAGIHVPLALDPCWAGIQVHRDGDTLVWDEVVGDGCEMVVTTDFAGDPHDTEIHVVQQSGNIQPPHIFDHDADGTTVLAGLPDGTWYVRGLRGRGGRHDDVGRRVAGRRGRHRARRRRRLDGPDRAPGRARPDHARRDTRAGDTS